MEYEEKITSEELEFEYHEGEEFGKGKLPQGIIGAESFSFATIPPSVYNSAPDIRTPSDIDITQIPGAEFITLPIMKVDSVSRNNRRFKRSAVESVMHAVNAHRPEGYKGHIKDTDLATIYPEVQLRWVAAEMDGNGYLWAKALVMTDKARSYYKISDAIKAKVGTSLRGIFYSKVNEGSEISDIVDINLFSIDMAPPALVGVPETSSLAKLSSEFFDLDKSDDILENYGKIEKSEEITNKNERSTEMTAETSKATSGAEQTVDPGTIGFLEVERQRREYRIKVKELENDNLKNRPYLEAASEMLEITDTRDPETALATVKHMASEMKTIAEILGTPSAKHVADKVRAMKNKQDEVEQMRATLAREMIDLEIERAVQIVSVRDTIKDLVAAEMVTNREQAKGAVASVLARPHIASMLRSAVAAEMGKPVDKTDEPRDKSKDEKYITIPNISAS